MSKTWLATLRGEGHHRQPTWGGHADCFSVVDTFNTSKREGRCLGANIHPNCPDNIRLRLEKERTIHPLFLNNFSHSASSSSVISWSPAACSLPRDIPFSCAANSSEVTTFACASIAV